MSDEKYGFLIKKIYYDCLKWKCVENSKLPGRIYIPKNDKGDKFLLYCYSEENAFLYRLYINREKRTIGGIQRYLERMILKKKPETISELDLSEYYQCNIEKNKRDEVTKERRLIKIGIENLSENKRQ